MIRIIVIIFLFSLSSQALATFSSPIIGKQFMVVSAQHYATQVGLDILKRGGNAIDAAVAMGYALAVVHPGCGNLGGGGFMLIRFADGRTTFINFREKAPYQSSDGFFLDPKTHTVRRDYLSRGHIIGDLTKPYLAVGVPGTVMGLNTALKQYGTLSLQAVISPAIALAEQGFTVSNGDLEILSTAEKAFRKNENTRAIFLRNGKLPAPGEKLRQKNLAHTLEIIAKGGTKAFYQGVIAKQIVSASQKNGGLITEKDLKNYTITEIAPLRCSYRGYEVITAPPPGSGITICEALEILTPYSLTKFGFHGALSSHYVLEAMRFAYADRDFFLGDPEQIKVPVKFLLSSQHIRQIQQQINPRKAANLDPVKFVSREGSNTTAYVVVDKAGNAVSVTYTLNDYFGAKVIPGKTGFFLNNEMADFTIKTGDIKNTRRGQGKNNLLAPNKRPMSAMAPTILTKNNQLFMVIGTPGGITIPSQLVSVILNVIDYGMNIQEAEDMPRYHVQWEQNLVFIEPFTFSIDTLSKLRAMGYRFKAGSPYGTPFWGSVAGIVAKNDFLFGAIDSRKSTGAAMGDLVQSPTVKTRLPQKNKRNTYPLELKRVRAMPQVAE